MSFKTYIGLFRIWQFGQWLIYLEMEVSRANVAKFSHFGNFLIIFLITNLETATEQKMRFSIKDFFSKCDLIRSFQRIWSHFLKKSLMENFIFCAVVFI